MKFWKSLMDILKDTLEEIKDISALLFKKELGKIAELANENPIKTIKSNPLIILESNIGRRNIIIQNIGIEPCYIKLGDKISIGDFHCILASDTFEKQGNGGSIKLENWHGEVYAICEKETKLSVLEY